MMGDDPLALVSASSCPFYYFPCQNDSEEEYGEEGKYVKALRAKFGDDNVKTTRLDAIHGVMNRGDPEDAKTAAIQADGFKAAVEYLKARL